MSRAFVKEADGTEVEELPERPISADPNLVTARGLALIEAEIARLREALNEAQAKEEASAIAELSRDLRYWTARRVTAEVVPPPQDSDTVRFGLRVTVKRDNGRPQSFRIVGQDEADPTKGLLSYVSPMARALIGKEVGDVVQAGTGEVEIVKIEKIDEDAA